MKPSDTDADIYSSLFITRFISFGDLLDRASLNTWNKADTLFMTLLFAAFILQATGGTCSKVGAGNVLLENKSLAGSAPNFKLQEKNSHFLHYRIWIKIFV